MKQIIIILIFLISVIVLEPTGLADSSKTRQITGSVTAIDITNSKITVTKKSKEVTVNVEEKTRFTQCTNNATIHDVKIGDKVTAKYKESAGGNTAKSITISDTTGKNVKKTHLKTKGTVPILPPFLLSQESMGVNPGQSQK